MNEEQKRIKAIIDEQIRLLAENPKLKGKTDAQLWTSELRSRAAKANHANPEYRAKWDEKNKIGAQTRSQNPELRKNLKIGGQKRSHNPEWRENTKLANQKKAHNPEWLANQKVGIRQKYQDPEFREKQKLGTQKSNSKKISCDGVIYESGRIAAISLAPATSVSIDAKGHWLKRQMKKFPERYFYITQSE